MGIDHEHPAHEVLVAGIHGPQTLSAAALRPIFTERHAFHVASMRHGHDHFLVWDEILDRDVSLRFYDFGAAGVTEALADLIELCDDDLIEQLLAREDGLQLADHITQGAILGR